MTKEIQDYLSGLPPDRKKRINLVRKAFHACAKDLDESMKYRMPTFEKGPNWVASVGNQKNYVSVYFCSEEMIENIKSKHPHLDTGKGCVRIRDNQDIPIEDLVVSFRKALRFKKAG